jgi:hypothetical protein
LPLKQAVALTAQATGLARNALYEQALAWRDAQAGGSGEPGDPVPTAPAAAAPPADWPADPRRVAAAAKPARRRGR